MAWHHWEHLTTTDLAAPGFRDAVAVLPVGAVEQHGPHLPLGTDAILVDGVLDAALDRLPDSCLALRLPTQRVGLSPEHAGFAGTLTLDPGTVMAQWTAIGAAVARAGIRRLMLVNGHGGQAAMVDVVAMRLRAEHGMTVARVTYFDLIGGDPAIDGRERRFGWHGGQVETALMLALRPELVRRDRLDDFVSAAESVADRYRELRVEGTAGLGWMAEDLNPSGATGNAAAATEAIGRHLLDRVAGRLAVLIGELHAFEGFGG
ncbi:creatininase [Thalassobaculum fulvum]|uniref:Creatininase n=1 Tax=Thalassobaculum fulvum TaxID=1633335 RepID=A0A919CPR2_9PROT|nr:creatininase family protein [Thalassobaculum fulvum]GHD51475.1 creatininase [Thalassobaculum fulvum]